MPREPSKDRRASKRSITVQARKLVRSELIAQGASRVDEERREAWQVKPSPRMEFGR
jgi:hypothetical protein